VEISPESLNEETSEERQERFRRTGVIGPGKLVLCNPIPEDPGVTETKSRVTCLTRPYAHCGSCNHSNFSLIFRVDTRERLGQVVACPKWTRGLVDRTDGKPPDHYEPTEVSTCKKMPFEFCPSCPSIETVAKMSANKSKEGWYGRWNRFKKLEFDQDD